MRLSQRPTQRVLLRSCRAAGLRFLQRRRHFRIDYVARRSMVHRLITNGCVCRSECVPYVADRHSVDMEKRIFLAATFTAANDSGCGQVGGQRGRALEPRLRDWMQTLLLGQLLPA